MFPILIIIQVITFTLWNVIGEFKLNKTVIDARRFIISYTCGYGPVYIFLIIEIIAMELICSVSIYFLRLTWQKLVTSVPELKWNILAANNFFLGLILLIPLTAMIVQNDDDVCAVYSTTILFTTVGTVLALVWHQFKISAFSCFKSNKKTSDNDISTSLLQQN